jgi:hypothetical protein
MNTQTQTQNEGATIARALLTHERNAQARRALSPMKSLRRFPAREAHLETLLPRALRSLAVAVADKRGRKDARALALRAELVTEAESAAGEAVALICARFPFALSALSARLALVRAGYHKRASFIGPIEPHSLVSVFPLQVWRAAHKACDRALRKMAREVATEDLPAKFDAGAPVSEPVFTVGVWINPWHARDARIEMQVSAETTPEDTALALTETKIRLRAERLRAAIRARAEGGNGYLVRSASAFLRRVDAWQARALALARGEDSAPLPVLSSRPERERETVETLAIYDRSGRPVATDGRGGVSGTRKRKDGERFAVYSRAFKEIKRLEYFLGTRLSAL